MSEHADAEAIAESLQQLLGRQRETLRLARASVTAVTGGLLSLQQGGMSGELDAGSPRLLPKVPAVSDEVIYADLGGAPVVLGVLGGAAAPAQFDLGAPLLGQSYTVTRSQGASDTTNTTNIDPTFADAMSLTWSSSAIPDGTYDLSVSFDLLIAHSGGGAVVLRTIAGANNGGSHTLNGDTGTTATLRVAVQNNYNNIVIAGGITIKGQFAVSSSGTAYARNPSIRAVAVRKG